MKLPDEIILKILACSVFTNDVPALLKSFNIKNWLVPLKEVSSIYFYAYRGSSTRTVSTSTNYTSTIFIAIGMKVVILVEIGDEVPTTLKSLINEQGGYVVFLVLSEYSFIRDFRVVRILNSTTFSRSQKLY